MRIVVNAKPSRCECPTLTSFMYLFMCVLRGHFSLSNSPRILAQVGHSHLCGIFFYPPTHNLTGDYNVCFVSYHSSSQKAWRFVCDTSHIADFILRVRLRFHMSKWFHAAHSHRFGLLASVASFVAFEFRRCKGRRIHLSNWGGRCLTIRVSCLCDPKEGFTKLLLRISIQTNPAS